MSVTILDSHKPYRRHRHTRFFFCLFYCILFNGLIHIHPAARQGPSAVHFLHQQDFAVPDNRRPAVQLGRLVACFPAEQPVYLFKSHRCVAADDLRRNFPYSPEPLLIKGIPGIGKPCLGYKLQLHRPFQPLMFPEGILFQQESGIYLFRTCQIPVRTDMGRGCASPKGQRPLHTGIRSTIHVIDRIPDKYRILRTGIFPAQIFLYRFPVRLVYYCVIRTDYRIKITLQPKRQKIPFILLPVPGCHNPQTGSFFLKLFQQLRDSREHFYIFPVTGSQVPPEIHNFRDFLLRKAKSPQSRFAGDSQRILQLLRFQLFSRFQIYGLLKRQQHRFLRIQQRAVHIKQDMLFHNFPSFLYLSYRCREPAITISPFS